MSFNICYILSYAHAYEYTFAFMSIENCTDYQNTQRHRNIICGIQMHFLTNIDVKGWELNSRWCLIFIFNDIMKIRLGWKYWVVIIEYSKMNTEMNSTRFYIRLRSCKNMQYARMDSSSSFKLTLYQIHCKRKFYKFYSGPGAPLQRHICTNPFTQTLHIVLKVSHTFYIIKPNQHLLPTNKIVE